MNKLASRFWIIPVACLALAALAAEQNSTSIRLKGEPKELARDDGASAGKRSIAGSGHAVRFDAPGTNYYLKAVRIFGSRYGQPAPPREDAHVWLCDADFKLIQAFPFPYSAFERGAAKWVTIQVQPTRLPSRFILCVGFDPTATKGVYVHYDSAGTGGSLVGLPGGEQEKFDKGDWLIRAAVQEGEN